MRVAAIAGVCLERAIAASHAFYRPSSAVFVSSLPVSAEEFDDLGRTIAVSAFHSVGLQRWRQVAADEAMVKPAAALLVGCVNVTDHWRELSAQYEVIGGPIGAGRTWKYVRAQDVGAIEWIDRPTWVHAEATRWDLERGHARRFFWKVGSSRLEMPLETLAVCAEFAGLMIEPVQLILGQIGRTVA
ncbi:MAG: hypothetical protein H7124_08895 [Phycisphaerales bacterium]|nr:hypothetical protein [Hyphomonadaceae bacterium]